MTRIYGEPTRPVETIAGFDQQEEPDQWRVVVTYADGSEIVGTCHAIYKLGETITRLAGLEEHGHAIEKIVIT
jgi:hypothetical protein